MTLLQELKRKYLDAKDNAESIANSLTLARQPLTEAIEKLTAEWEAGNAELISAASETADKAAAAELMLRDSIIEAFQINGEKKFGDGMSVRINKTATYDEAAATALCAERGFTSALKLNRKQFEKIAETLQLDSVTWSEKPTAVIGK